MIYDQDGKPKAEPKEADVWSPLKHNKSVEVNQHGIYRTKDFKEGDVQPQVKPVDDYYGYEGWGLFPDGE